MTPQLRLSIAKAQLAACGEPKEGESLKVTQKREHYRRQEQEALAEISEAQRASLPYKDDD